MRAIVFQQLAGRAAQAIYGRVRAAVGETLTPEAVNAVSGETLRAAGLSGNKLASLRDLSAKVLDGTVILSRTSRRSDEELIERLTTVRGIGRWTAEIRTRARIPRLARALPIRADVVDNFDLKERKFRSRAMTAKPALGFG